MSKQWHALVGAGKVAEAVEKVLAMRQKVHITEKLAIIEATQTEYAADKDLFYKLALKNLTISSRAGHHFVVSEHDQRRLANAFQYSLSTTSNSGAIQWRAFVAKVTGDSNHWRTACEEAAAERKKVEQKNVRASVGVCGVAWRVAGRTLTLRRDSGPRVWGEVPPPVHARDRSAQPRRGLRGTMVAVGAETSWARRAWSSLAPLGFGTPFLPIRPRGSRRSDAPADAGCRSQSRRMCHPTSACAVRAKRTP